MPSDGPTPVPYRESIAGRITSRSILLAAIPVLLVGLVAVTSLLVLSRRADEARDELVVDTIGPTRAEDAELILVRLDDYLDERIDDVIDWSRSAQVVEAAGEDWDGVDELASLPIDAVEQRFEGTDVLDTSGFSSRYLIAEIEQRPAFAEVFFTDGNGFNVAATNPTSDFVQRDEDWWQDAWNNGLFVGPIVFDDSAEVTSIEVAARIDDRSGRAIGVLKAVIDASALQAFADAARDNPGEASGVEVRVLNGDGVLLAETATDHDPRRVGTAAEFDGDRAAAFEQATSTLGDDAQPATSGYVLLDETVAGYAWSPGTRQVDRLDMVVPVEQWISIVEQPEAAALAPLSGVEALQSDLNLSARTLALIVIGLVVAVLIIAYLVSRLIARRIAGPINELQVQAYRVANHDLPRIVDTLHRPGVDPEIPRIEPIDVEARGEVGELVNAFNSIQSTALQLAAQEAIGRTRDVSTILLSLGRRNQQLVGRQLGFIDQLERSVDDPDMLAHLFELDQMATRMRRNAESLLVLAGHESSRRGSGPVAVDTVIREAMSAVEDYARIDLESTDRIWIVPRAAADVSHLLAELMENPTIYSPPTTRVQVVGRIEADGSYTISIVDAGIGMSDEALAAANARIGESSFSDEASASQIGLLVVGRLAARHGIKTRLVESSTSGLTAKATIPIDLLVSSLEIEGRPADDIASSPERPGPTAAEPDSSDGGEWSLVPARPQSADSLASLEDPIPVRSGRSEAAVVGFGPPPSIFSAEAGADVAPLNARRRTRATSEEAPLADYTVEQSGHGESPLSQQRADEVRSALSNFTAGFASGRADAAGQREADTSGDAPPAARPLVRRRPQGRPE